MASTVAEAASEYPPAQEDGFEKRRKLDNHTTADDNNEVEEEERDNVNATDEQQVPPQPTTGPSAPPTPQEDGRYYDPYHAMRGQQQHPPLPYDHDGSQYHHPHEPQPPSMPYAKGGPMPPPKHHHHAGHPPHHGPPPPHPPSHPYYGYPPPKDYYQYHPEYPPHHPHQWGPPPPPHHYHHGKPPPHNGQPPFSPRYHAPPYEYDAHRQHYEQQQQQHNHAHPNVDPNAAGSRSKPPPTNAEYNANDNINGSYPSPNSVIVNMHHHPAQPSQQQQQQQQHDTRSPEGSRNLNNFEERVGAAPNTVGGHHHPPPMYHHPHSPYYQQPPIHSPAAAAAQTNRQWWSCDYCSYKFSTWEECSAHESMCPSNSNSNSRGKKRSTADMLLSDDPSAIHFEQGEEYANNTDRPTFSLALPADGQSLSDRQCYVRTHFVELFVASESDVSSRHSRGAQKLHLNQVGLRCAYCAKLKPRDRAERAVCYPSSISRIYQTVADMQRFHFENCTAIPSKVLRVYKSLKTTRPRGVGSPQSYWDKSARELGLVDTEGCGIGLRDGSILMQREGGGADGGNKGYGRAAMENQRGDNGYGQYDHNAPHQHPVMSPHNMSPGQQHHMMSEHGRHVETYAHDHANAIITTPQEDTASQENDMARNNEGQPPSEADASILLMLKNPDAASPKSESNDNDQVDGMAEVREFIDDETRTKMAQV